jgi:hypothetical protein
MTTESDETASPATKCNHALGPIAKGDDSFRPAALLAPLKIRSIGDIHQWQTE